MKISPLKEEMIEAGVKACGPYFDDPSQVNKEMVRAIIEAALAVMAKRRDPPAVNIL